MEEKRSFIFDIAWIKRGVAKAVPDKIKIEQQELKEIIQCENETSEDETTDANEELMDDQRVGLRGSMSNLAAPEGIEKYGLEKYDEEGVRVKNNLMAGVAVFASPLEDPYITQHVDSDEEEEKDDFLIKPNDNLVAVAKVIKDEPSIEVYVFNEEHDDWYLHHDYLLDAPPLCLASFAYDPGADNKKGNLLAVGTMDSIINVWDLDIVNAVEPVLSLGTSTLKKKSKKGKTRSKRDGTALGHSDAVLCLDWNKRSKHVLASGSADQTVVLWDLDQAMAATILSSFNGMVQSIEWHPVEESIIMAGTRTGRVAVSDCRNSEAEIPAEWSFGDSIEIEKVLWDCFNPFNAYVVSDDGYLRYLDMRNSNTAVVEVLCHENGTTGVSQSVYTKGLLATCGDKEFKIWRSTRNEIKLVYTHSANMGELHTVKFSPDSGNILIVGGETEEMVRVYDLHKFDKITGAFCSNGKDSTDDRME